MNRKEFYSMKVARDARQVCEEKTILDKSQLVFDLETLKNILNFFKTKLIEDSDKGYSICKTKEKNYDFIIYYALGETDNTSQKIDKLKVLSGLAQMFLAEDKITDEIQKIDKLTVTNLYSETFVREFLMPEDLFLKQINKNLKDGKINISNVAQSFDIDVLQADARGKELQLY